MPASPRRDRSRSRCGSFACALRVADANDDADEMASIDADAAAGCPETSCDPARAATTHAAVTEVSVHEPRLPPRRIAASTRSAAQASAAPVTTATSASPTGAAIAAGVPMESRTTPNPSLTCPQSLASKWVLRAYSKAASNAENTRATTTNTPYASATTRRTARHGSSASTRITRIDSTGSLTSAAAEC